MRAVTALAQFFLTLGAAALPATGLNVYRRSSGRCLTRADAEQVAKNFKDLQDEVFNVTLAREAVAPDFVDYNDSINTLINQGCPNGPQELGSPTFASRAEYFAAARLQAPTPYEQLNLWYTCDTVIARWRAIAPYAGVTGVAPQEDVTGIVVIEVTPNPDTTSEQPFQFQTIYSEFNSFAWGYDLGLFVPRCTPNGEPLPTNSTDTDGPSKRNLNTIGVRRL